MGVSQIAFLGLLALVGAGRMIELRVSKRNQARMVASGARHVPDFHFGWMVLWHGGALVCAGLEVVLLKRPFLPYLAAPMLAAFLFANLLRWWVIRSLAGHWNVRVMDSTSLGVVSNGPYRWIRHPNYLAVFLEMVALPLLHTAWWTASAAGVATIFIVARRLAVEEAVLLSSPAYRATMGARPRFIPGLFQGRR
jgi:methyltransferase